MRQPKVGLGFDHVRPLPLEGVLQVAGVDLEAELRSALGVEGARGLFELKQGASHVEGDEPPQPRHGSRLLSCAPARRLLHRIGHGRKVAQ